jgi:hypothetical protein
MPLKALFLSIGVICASWCFLISNVHADGDDRISILDLKRLRRKLLLINTDPGSNSNIDTSRKRQHDATTSSSNSNIKSIWEQTDSDFSSTNIDKRLLDTSEMIWDLTQERNRVLMSLSLSMSM